MRSAVLCALVAEALIPAAVQAEQMRQSSGSAAVSCIPPLKLVRRPGQCCPICWAEDHVVPLDRHMAGAGMYTVAPHGAAPPSCAGVKCFKLMCFDGTMPGYVTGSCCESCV